MIPLHFSLIESDILDPRCRPQCSDLLVCVRGLVRFILFVLSVVIHSSNNTSLSNSMFIISSFIRLFLFNQVRSLSNPDQIESKMEILWCPDTKSDDQSSEGIKFNSKPSVNSRFELNSDKLVSVNFVYLDFRKKC